MPECCPRPREDSAEPAEPRRRGVPQAVALALLRFYKVAVSPLVPPACRFHPTCSDYAREAIDHHGTARGALLAAKRLMRCHPFSPGGVDLVPKAVRRVDH